MIDLCLRSRILRIIAVAALFVGDPKSTRADIIYAVSGAGGTSPSSLYTLNPDGSLASTIGLVQLSGNNLEISGIFYDQQNSTLYGTTNQSGFDKNSLVTIDVATGQATLVGATSGLLGTMQGVTISSDGVVYGYSKTSNPVEALFTINISSSTGTLGAANLLGPSNIAGGTSGDGLAVNSSGKIYLASGGVGGTLYTLDAGTGAASTSGPTLTGTVPYNQVKGLVFDGATLYGINFQTGNPFPAHLISIDPNSGQMTDLGSATTPNGLIGLAIAVPEPGSFLLLGLVVAGFAIHRGNRQFFQLRRVKRLLLREIA